MKAAKAPKIPRKAAKKAPKTSKKVAAQGSGVPVKCQHFDVPSDRRAHLDSWGRTLRSKVEQVQRSGVPEFRRLDVPGLRIGTDCSGAEAPIWALREMGIPHRHIFSCDVDGVVRSFIQSASPPEDKVYEDMLQRSVADLPDIDVYVAGFPCTPYSLLRRHSTRMFKEKAARPYFELLKVLRAKRPALAILENVLGLRSVLPKVLRDLKRLRCYNIIYFILNPTHFGEPVSRPRYYFLLIRQDASALADTKYMVDFCTKCLSGVQSPVTQHVVKRMLPNNNPQVQAFFQEAAMRKRKASQRGVPVSQSASTSSMPWNTGRQQAVWSRVQQQMGTNDVIANVSQSISRCSPRTDGVCPTITPNGSFIVGVAQRPVLPCEKLLLNGFPLHRMKIPASVSKAALGRMGGNTMHLHCVGLVLLMGISLLKVTLPLPADSAHAAKAPEAVFIETKHSVSEKAESSGCKRRRTDGD